MRSAQHGLACPFGFVSREVVLRDGVRIECRLQGENFGAVGHGCFVRFVHLFRLGSEGLDLTSRAVSSAAWVASFWDMVCESASYLSRRSAWYSYRVFSAEHREWISLSTFIWCAVMCLGKAEAQY